jgi:hypothetical protein
MRFLRMHPTIFLTGEGRNKSNLPRGQQNIADGCSDEEPKIASHLQNANERLISIRQGGQNCKSNSRPMVCSRRGRSNAVSGCHQFQAEKLSSSTKSTANSTADTHTHLLSVPSSPDTVQYATDFTCTHTHTHAHSRPLAHHGQVASSSCSMEGRKRVCDAREDGHDLFGAQNGLLHRCRSAVELSTT